jgi:hypothetical protein
MSSVLEPAVRPDENSEGQTVLSIPAPQQESPSPRENPIRKPKRFSASLRFNGLRYLTLASALLLSWGLVRGAMWEGAGSPEATFMLVLAGGLLAAGAKTAIDILNWADAARQAAHVERMHAVQRVFQRACAVRESGGPRLAPDSYRPGRQPHRSSRRRSGCSMTTTRRIARRNRW